MIVLSGSGSRLIPNSTYIGLVWLLAFFLLLAGSAGVNAGLDSSGETYQKLAAQLEAGGSRRVLVRLDLPVAGESSLSAAAIRRQRARIARAQARVEERLAGTGSKTRRNLTSVPLVAVEVDESGLSRLAEAEVVESVRAERSFSPLEVELGPALETSVPRLQADDLHDTATGDSSTLAVLDTGFDTHPAFGGRTKFVAEACFSDGDCPNGGDTMYGPTAASALVVDDTSPHGTHVASIAAGLPAPGIGLDTGVAFDGRLVGINVFHVENGQARAYESDVLAGLEWLLDVAADSEVVADTPVVVANLSLGGGRYTGYCDDQFPEAYKLFDNLRSAGVVPVVAAGNDGYSSAVNWPACFSNTVAVGATETDPGEQIWSGSNRDPEMSPLVAPGVQIAAAVPGESVDTISGTSMAAPHVAGGLAILREAARAAEVGAGADELVAALRTTAEPVTADGTYGSVRLLKAYNFLAGSEEITEAETKFKIIPNPYRPGDGDPRTGTSAHGVHFVNLPTDFRLSVYSITGEKVVSHGEVGSDGSWEWEPSETGSGTYLVVVEDRQNGGVQKRKLGFIK